MIKKAYPDNNVSVKVDSIVPGSVVVNTTTTFLDGDQAAAHSDAKALATAPGKIFPADTYGNVTTSDVSTGTAANPAGNSHHPHDHGTGLCQEPQALLCHHSLALPATVSSQLKLSILSTIKVAWKA